MGVMNDSLTPPMPLVSLFPQPWSTTPPRRQKMVNMLDEGDVESVADFSAFLLSKYHSPQ